MGCRDGVTTQADYVHNPTIVGFSFASPTSPLWEVLKTETLSILCAYLAYVDVKTLLQQGHILVGLLDEQWGRSAQKSKIPHTVRFTSIHYWVSGNQNFYFTPTETIDGRVKEIRSPTFGMV